MFPFCFEWAWEIGHYLFFGGMWYAIIIISCGMGYCLFKTIVETNSSSSCHCHCTKSKSQGH